MSFRLVPKSVTLNDLKRRIGRYCALSYRIWQSCQALSCSWSWRFLVLVLVFVLTCRPMVLFNNVWSCIMLFVTKLQEFDPSWKHHMWCTKLLRYVIYLQILHSLWQDFLYMPPSRLPAIIYIWLICVLRECYLFYPPRLRGRIYWKQ